MRRSEWISVSAWLLPVSLTLFACAADQKSQGLTKVDDLLTRVEQVQIESVVTREKASAAFDAFGMIVAPDFTGDPMVAFNDLVEKINASKTQAQKLEYSVEPMKQVADSVFLSWTMDLEKFGNTNLRQASQARLAETRARYSAVHDAAIAALVSIKAFNSDLSDQALFLEHDFNSAAVAVIAAEVPALTNQARDLSKRLNACVSTSKAYIASSALRGQFDEPAPEKPSVAAQTPAAPPARKLPNPMAEEGSIVDETANAPTTAPARRRPRANANQANPVAPTNGAPANGAQGAATPAAPNGATAPAQNTQPTALPQGKPLPVLGPQLPKPETDLTPKPAPIEKPADGAR